MRKLASSLKHRIFVSTDAFDFDDQHVQAGMVFNEIVGEDHLRTYFAKGVKGALSVHSESLELEGDTLTVGPVYRTAGYIAPGNIPTADADKVLYWGIYRWLKEQARGVEILVDVLDQYQSQLQFTEVVSADVSEQGASHAK